MTELLSWLRDTPVPTILIVAGIGFLAFALLQISVNVRNIKTTKPTSGRQIASGIVGAIMIAAGVLISLRPPPVETPSGTEAPRPTNTEATAILTLPPAASLPPPAATTAPQTEGTTEEPTEGPVTASNTIAISEVMAAPCVAPGIRPGPSNNEYIELYNYGAEPVDVGGWWIVANPGGIPQKLVTWDARNPGAKPEGAQVLTKTSVIPPSRFGIILAPLYQMGDPGTGTHEPYAFPYSTILLTVAQGKLLGSNTYGLLGNGQPVTTVLLYIGTSDQINTAVSTYGTPEFTSFPGSITDDGEDMLPRTAPDCYSASRVDPAGPDAVDNWQLTKHGTPGG